MRRPFIYRVFLQFRGFTRFALALPLVVSIAVFLYGPARAEGQRVKIAYSALSPVMAGVWMASEIGAFEKYGLKAELVYISSGAPVVQALVGGDLKMALAASNAVVSAALHGAPIVAVGSVANRAPMRLWVQPSITKPEQLIGKTLAISRPGSATDFLTALVLDQFGIKDKVKIQSFPSHGGDIAFKTGVVAGRITSTKPAPTARVLVDLVQMGIPFALDYLAISRDYHKKNPAAVESMIKAYLEGVAALNSRREQAIAVLRKYLGLREVSHLSITDTYDSNDIRVIQRDGRVDPKTVETLLQWMGRADVSATRFYDSSITDRLVKEGFVEGLYEQSSK